VGGVVAQALARVREQISELETRYGRVPDSVRLLAVSKTKPASLVREAYTAGQSAFGENHLQDAGPKLDALADLDIEWHFIGAIQSNKTRPIAERFAWVHGIDRRKIARRLNDQRPGSAPPLQVCLQINVSGEATKSGVTPHEAVGLASEVAAMPRLQLRGLMAIPAPTGDLAAQREPFRRLRELLDALNQRGLALDTLSMGMSADIEAAIAEGATIVRIGTAIFGPRS
jgi:pyridoxal phosphate enzyme (YggS family)